MGAPGFRPAPQCYRRRKGDVKSGPGTGVMPSPAAGVNIDASANASWDSHERRPRLLRGTLPALLPGGGG